MKILIGMPTSDGKIPSDMTKYLFNMSMPKNSQVGFLPIDRKEVCFARNAILKVAISDNYDYIRFLDDDNTPDQLDALEILLSYKKDMICGLVPTRERIDGKFNICIYDKVFNDYGLHSYQSYYRTPKKELTKLSACGMGCCLISRKVFEKLYRKFWGCPFEIRNMGYYKTKNGLYNEDNFNSLTDVIIAKYTRYTSESILFSERAIIEGFEIYSTNKITCKHIAPPEMINIDFHCNQLNLSIKNNKGK